MWSRSLKLDVLDYGKTCATDKAGGSQRLKESSPHKKVHADDDDERRNYILLT